MTAPPVLRAVARAADVTLAEARAIAAEAYIDGFPLVEMAAGGFDKRMEEMRCPRNHRQLTPVWPPQCAQKRHESETRSV